MTSDPYVIYGLIDPRSGELRYVGKTAYSLKKRLREHLSLTRLGTRRYLYNWLRQLLAVDLKPDIEILETCETPDALNEAERFYIAYFRMVGCRLTNLTAGGEGLNNPSPEVRAKLSAGRRDFRHTPEAKAKISAAGKGRVPYNKGKAMSENQRQKLIGRCGRKGAVIVDEQGVIYQNSAVAERELGLPSHTLSRAIRRGYMVRGHRFRVVQNVVER